MPSEREALKTIEEKIGKKFEQVDYYKLTDWSKRRCYAVNKNQKIIGLNIILKELPDVVELQYLPNLISLNLSYNSLKDISELQYLQNLSRLILRNNLIEDISVLKNLENLKTLNASRNIIANIGELRHIPNLTSLILGTNEISDITVIQHLQNLTQLDLSKNKIQIIPQKVFDLPLEIKWDKFYYNNGINFYGNPIQSPPIEILKQGREAVLAYFASLGKEKRPLNEVRVLLVGDGGAGKTSLVKKLLGLRFNKKESQTHGINIRDWSFKTKKKDVRVRFWDFGGQEIMHATHQFFLSKRSLYVLVLDCRKDERTEYWLKHIESFGGDSPILVVLNKIDENPGFEVNRKQLQEKYPGIQGFFRLSCSKGTGVADFKKELKNALLDVEMLETAWPGTWFNVKTRLEQMEDSYISYDRYNEICNEEEIDGEIARETLVEFLNDLGVVLHFDELSLHDTHVLEPKWVTGAVYKIVNSPELAERKGELPLRLLTPILQKTEKADFEYPKNKHGYIVEVMKKFELCYEIDSNAVLVPDLLDPQEPPIDPGEGAALRFYFEYDFLPPSVMPRFIVKRHKDIKDALRWRTGVVLKDESCCATAIVKADRDDKRIYIEVYGERKRDYFAVVRKTIRDINSTFEKIGVTEWVPLPGYDDNAVEYDELLGYEKANQEDMFVGKLGKAFSVSTLLDGIEDKRERMVRYNDDRSMSIRFDPHIEVKPVIHNENNIQINIKNDLPALQELFQDFKDAVEGKNPKLSAELAKIEDGLDEVTPSSPPEAVNKPLNKLGRMLKKLGDEKSDWNKALKGGKKVVECAQTLAGAYNKIGPLLGCPKIPDFLLKKK